MKLIQNSFTGVGSASVATTLTGSRIDITIYDQIEIEIDTVMSAVITVLYFPIDNKLTDVITRVYPITANNKSTLTIDILQRLIQVNVVINAGAHPYSFITNAHRQYRPTEPIRASNTLELFSMLVGNWYQVLSLGNTIGAVWNACGALLPQVGETLPPIGRAFCCLAIGPLVSGGGQVVSIVYSNNVNVSGSIIGGTVAVSNFPAVQVVSGTVDIGSSVPIAITNTSFDVGNFPASQAVTGTFFQATQPVSGTVDIGSSVPIAITNTSFEVSNLVPLPSANIRTASELIVGNWFKVESLGNTIGAVWNQMGAIIGSESNPPIGRVFKCLMNGNGTGTVSTVVYSQNIDNFPASQAVTGTFFQATQPVSGTVDIGSSVPIAITNTSFDVGNFPASQAVTGTFFQATQPVSGTVDIGSSVPIAITNTSFDVGNFPASQAVTGTFFQATQPVSGTVDIGSSVPIAITNTSFEVSNLVPLPSANIRTASELIVGNWFKVESLGTTIGAVWHQMGAIIGSESNPPIGRVFKCLMNGNGTGTVSTVVYSQNIDNFPVSQAVTGTFFQATQPVSGTVDIGSSVPIAITNTSFDVGNFPASQAVTGTFFQATQPVSGTVDIGSSVPIAITNTSFDVGNFPASQAVTGTFFQATQPVSGTVDIGSSVPIAITNTSFDVGNFPASVDIGSSVPIAITNTSFDAVVTNIPHVIVDTLPASPSIHCVSLNAISTTSQTIGYKDRIRTITVSNIGVAVGFNFCYLKIYASATATDADTPIANIGVRSGETLVINCDLNVPYTTVKEICCRATDDFSTGSTTAPTGTITASFFIYNS
jgi:predicted enzyme related to lactoylglutathione lyase